MNCDDITASVKVAACVCAIDGLISQSEEEIIFQIVLEKFPEYKLDSFNAAIEDFFESSDQIEDYLTAITNQEMRNFTMHLCKKSASADGLDFRENLAIQKACLIWGIENNE